VTHLYYIKEMKTLVVRVSDSLAAEIEAASRERGISKSEVVRERLRHPSEAEPEADPLAGIADLIGSVKGGPADLSARKKDYLRAWGYGRNRSPR
jgi:hypothetical protein